MIRFMLLRVLGALPILALVTVVCFLLIELVPGDPARSVAGEFATPEQVEAVRVALGLDQNLIVRYLIYIRNVLSGDFGESVVLQPGQRAMDLIMAGFPITFSLSLVSLIIAVVVAVPFGVVAALKRDSLIDHMLTGLMSISMAVPPFVVGPVLVVLLAISNPWLPAVGYQPLSEGFWTWLSHLILPASALAVNAIAELARQIRGALIDVMDQSYIRTANAKGLRPAIVVGKHAVKNAAVPAVTVLGLQVTRVIGGTVVVEVVFAMPGIGSLAVNSVLANDFPVVQTLVLFSAVIVLIANLLVDMSYGYFNPRLRKA